MHEGSHRVVVVLSAMSSYKKSEGTTSRLLAASNEILRPNSTEYLNIVDLIENDHVRAIHEAIPLITSNNDNALDLDKIRSEAERDVRLECEKLKSFMSAAEVSFMWV